MTIDISGFGYIRHLILTTEKLYNFDKSCFFTAQEQMLEKTDKGYILNLVCENIDDYTNENTTEKTENIKICFTEATVEIKPYRLNLTYFYTTPWESLTVLATEIIGKQSLGEQYLNEKEKALLPLLHDIDAMWYYDSITDSNISFSNIIKLLKKHNLEFVIKALKKVQKNDSVFKIMNVQNKLNFIKTEPLWREIYEMILESQKEYPDYYELSSNYKKLSICPADIHKRIEFKMHSLGYEGSFPDFYKSGKLKGIHLISNYNLKSKNS